MVIASGCATLQVADFDRAISFYTETLELRLIVRFGDEWACLDAGEGMLIGLIPCSQGNKTGHLSRPVCVRAIRLRCREPPPAGNRRR